MIPPNIMPTTCAELTLSDPSLLSVTNVVTSGAAPQSKACILSRAESHVGSNWRRDDPTLMEAAPLCTQVCTSAAMSEALRVGVPVILAL